MEILNKISEGKIDETVEKVMETQYNQDDGANVEEADKLWQAQAEQIEKKQTNSNHRQSRRRESGQTPVGISGRPKHRPRVTN